MFAKNIGAMLNRMHSSEEIAALDSMVSDTLGHPMVAGLTGLEIDSFGTLIKIATDPALDDGKEKLRRLFSNNAVRKGLGVSISKYISNHSQGGVVEKALSNISDTGFIGDTTDWESMDEFITEGVIPQFFPALQEKEVDEGFFVKCRACGFTGVYHNDVVA